MGKKVWLRVRIDEQILKEYKILCIENDLSIPKQTNEIIKNFVRIQKDNLEKKN